jgi:hypothetical protein
MMRVVMMRVVMMRVVMMRVVMMRVVMMSVTLFIVMLIVNMLNVVMLSVIMLFVVAPSLTAIFSCFFRLEIFNVNCANDPLNLKCQSVSICRIFVQKIEVLGPLILPKLHQALRH